MIAAWMLPQFATAQSCWSPVTENQAELTGKRQIIPQRYSVFRLDVNTMRQKLSAAPHESASSAAGCIIELPLPDGRTGRFRVVESPIMAAELQASFPNIKTYSIRGIDDIYASGKIDWNDFGFHGMVFSPDGDFFVDPYCLNNVRDYISYYTADFVKDPQFILPEGQPVSSDEGKTEDQKRPALPAGTHQRPAAVPCAGANLRTYRLAVACTGEYAIAAVGNSSPTLSQVLSRVVTSVNRVDGVYEKEVAVRLTLIATTTLVLYTDPATDSFTGTANSNATALINLSQSVITASIGSSNFDIGHTFSTGGGGLANLACVCVNSQKARGITGSGNPVGDPYDIDYVAHEMGHQFGGNHTFNAITGSCNGNRDPLASVEPGSGVTIMAYAGICSGNNIAGNSIPYFHGYSYDEIYNFVSFGASCASVTPTGNNPPQVSAVSNFAVPKSTPFSITGSATDPDGDPLLYSWEEMDAGSGGGGNWNSGNAPYFRSYAPVTTGTRFFPRVNVVQSNNYTGTIGEYLPGKSQTLDFRLTARDNKMGGGGVCYTNMQVQVDTAGPFQVLYPSASGISWFMSSTKMIQWDPASTDQPPVSCDSVRILISYNSGTTYSTLVGSAPNFGFYNVVVPTLSATINTCRVRIEAKGNTFYDIGNFDFTISSDPEAGIAETSRVNAFALTVWPNPVSGILNVTAANMDGGDKTRMVVTDLIGREVIGKTIDGAVTLRTSVDVSALRPGVYFISLTNHGQTAVHRFIVE